MKKIFTFKLLTILLLLSCYNNCFIQGDYLYAIQGRITDSLDNPIENVKVEAMSGSYTLFETLFTDENGEYIYLQDGLRKYPENIVRFSKDGYTTVERNITEDTYGIDRVATVNIVLEN